MQPLGGITGLMSPGLAEVTTPGDGGSRVKAAAVVRGGEPALVGAGRGGVFSRKVPCKQCR